MLKYNKVYEHGSNKELTPLELIRAFGFDSEKYIGKITPMEMLERVAGYHCSCGNGQGTFELLPVNHPDVISGGKRYMICRKCGCMSHL